MSRPNASELSIRATWADRPGDRSHSDVISFQLRQVVVEPPTAGADTVDRHDACGANVRYQDALLKPVQTRPSMRPPSPTLLTPAATHCPTMQAAPRIHTPTFHGGPSWVLCFLQHGKLRWEPSFVPASQSCHIFSDRSFSSPPRLGLKQLRLQVLVTGQC